jgi:carbamoyl-phosphate synthase small subunit
MPDACKALIALEDGTTFEGRAFAGPGEVEGELVFNTSMTGYQEILTDPSYRGQIVTLCYPLIGNYGVNPEDEESARPQAAGLVIGENSRLASNFRSREDLPTYLQRNGLFGVHGVDTRAITLHLRSRGAMKCVMSSLDTDRDSLVAKARASRGLVGRDLTREVCTDRPYRWRPEAPGDRPRKVVVLDCGLKFNQLRLLQDAGCDVHVYPNYTPAAEILAARPDGFFISNGPGDPEGAGDCIRTVGEVARSGVPTFGICFGHQMLGLGLGGRTFKLKFGHRGGNQPVKNLLTGRVEITSQNHGFCVDKDSLPADVETTHINLNDGTSEGLRHRRLPIFSVQYHPEAAPGPHDSAYLFTQFRDLIDARA